MAHIIFPWSFSEYFIIVKIYRGRECTIMAGNTSIVCNNELVWETEIITNIILLKQEKISLESHKKKLDEQRRFGNTGHLILVTRLTDETINIIKAAEDEYYLLRGAISVEGVDSAF